MRGKWFYTSTLLCENNRQSQDSLSHCLFEREEGGVRCAVWFLLRFVRSASRFLQINIAQILMWIGWLWPYIGLIFVWCLSDSPRQPYVFSETINNIDDLIKQTLAEIWSFLVLFMHYSLANLLVLLLFLTSCSNGSIDFINYLIWVNQMPVIM